MAILKVFDRTTGKFVDITWAQGAPGVRGSRWYAGTAITGKSTAPTAYATGITDAIDGDMYINTATSYVYKCTQGGDESTALWVYSHSQKGLDGSGAGDMTKAVYDADNDGIVDNAAKLGGLPPEDYAKKSDIPSAINTHNSDDDAHSAQFDNKLDKSGGTMTGMLTLHDDPSQPMHAATKQYVDSKTSIFNVTLDTSWLGSAAPYSKSVTVTGILETDTPIIDIVMSGTYATDEARQEAWGYVYRAVTADNSITFYANEKPSVELPVQIKVVR